MMFLAFMFGNLMAQNNIVVRKAKVQKNTKMNEKRPSNKEVYPYSIPIKNVSCLMRNFSTQIESVTLCEEMTIITLTIKDSWNNNMVNSNKTAYIEDVETGKNILLGVVILEWENHKLALMVMIGLLWRLILLCRELQNI